MIMSFIAVLFLPEFPYANENLRPPIGLALYRQTVFASVNEPDAALHVDQPDGRG
jgi:hypothetical protein